MPKGRHLKPDFFTDKNIVSMQPLARLLYEGLWCYAADCGHLDDEPVELKMRILPADSCDVDALLDEIAWNGRIERKEGVIFLPKLSDHARVDRRYETKCEACKQAESHDVTTPSKAPPSAPGTTGTRRDNAVTTTGPQRDHVGDGDGDGDGDGERKPRASRATTLPKSFAPNDTNRRVADEQGVNVDALLPQFVDFHTAKGSTMKDWHAALNTWIRRERPNPGGTAKVHRLPHASELELPPDGLSVEEYDAWDRAQRAKRAGR